MSKKYYIASAISLIMSAASVQAAPPTAELKVKGDLTVPVCTVAATGDGTYDLGKLSSTLIKASANTSLTPIIQSWTVTCDADTYLVFKPADNRDGTSSDSAATSFGLGMVNDTGKVGFYQTTINKATVDGQNSSVFSSNSATFAIGSSALLTKGVNAGWASAANTLKSGKIFAVDISVQPYLASSASMKGAITDEVKVDGSMTLNFAYGI